MYDRAETAVQNFQVTFRFMCMWKIAFYFCMYDEEQKPETSVVIHGKWFCTFK